MCAHWKFGNFSPNCVIKCNFSLTIKSSSLISSLSHTCHLVKMAPGTHRKKKILSPIHILMLTNFDWVHVSRQNRLRILGSIHSHFVHSISNSRVDNFDIDSFNLLIFCAGCLMTKFHLIRHWISYDVEYDTVSSSNNRYKK